MSPYRRARQASRAQDERTLVPGVRGAGRRDDQGLARFWPERHDHHHDYQEPSALPV